MASGSACGQDFKTFNTGSGSWHDDSLWSPAGAPTWHETRIGGSTARIANIFAGNVTNSNPASIGYAAGETGTVNVLNGRTWEITNFLYVGNEGSGTLNVQAGSTLKNSSNGYIGHATGSTGVVTVTGAGSQWQASSSLYVGNQGAGTLTIADGGKVTPNSGELRLAAAAGSQGTLNLNGTPGIRGVLEIGYVSEGSGAGKINFDGGILRAKWYENDFLRNFEPGDVELLSGGAFIDTNGLGNVGISAVLTGNGGLTKLNTGTLTLDAANSYTGVTTVEAGALKLGSSGSLAHSTIIQVNHGATFDVTAKSSFTIGGHQTLSGSGTVLGNVLIEGGHNPGSGGAPGILTHQHNLAYDNASVFWELTGNTTSGRGAIYDGINVNGSLSFSGATQLNLAFSNSVDWNNDFWKNDQAWLLYSVGGSLNDFDLNAFSIPSYNWLDGSGNAFNDILSPGSGFDLSEVNGDIWLYYTYNTSAIIPEPGRGILLLAGLLGAILRRRRSGASAA